MIVLGVCFDHCVVKEDVGIKYLLKDMKCVIDASIEVAKIDYSGSEEVALREKGYQDVSVDLLQFFDAAAICQLGDDIVLHLSEDQGGTSH